MQENIVPAFNDVPRESLAGRVTPEVSAAGMSLLTRTSGSVASASFTTIPMPSEEVMTWTVHVRSSARA